MILGGKLPGKVGRCRFDKRLSLIVAFLVLVISVAVAFSQSHMLLGKPCIAPTRQASLWLGAYPFFVFVFKFMYKKREALADCRASLLHCRYSTGVKFIPDVR